MARLRMGAVVFTDSSGAVVATTYLQGIGNGPLPVHAAVASSVSFSFVPGPVAVDAAGNLYIDGQDNEEVYQVGASGY
jgi:hypothetical protein